MKTKEDCNQERNHFQFQNHEMMHKMMHEERRIYAYKYLQKYEFLHEKDFLNYRAVISNLFYILGE